MNTQNVTPEDATTPFVQKAIALNLLKDAKNTQKDVAKMFKIRANTIKKFVRRTETSYPNEIAPKQGYKTTLAFNLDFLSRIGIFNPIFKIGLDFCPKIT